MSALVELQRHRPCTYEGGIKVIQITRSLPFYKKRNGEYVHRVRRMGHCIVRRTGEYSHTFVEFWCGGSGFLGSEKREGNVLLAEPPQNTVCCATCEGRAIGAGLTSSREICGRVVMFKPRV